MDDAHLDEKLTISLSKAACLVLFELLARSYEEWRKENPDDTSAALMHVDAVEHEQRVALWQLECALESTIPELFAANYLELVESSKKLLASGH